MKWIPISEGLPGHECGSSERVLVLTSNYIIFDAFFDKRHGWITFRNDWNVKNVTHWMPKPPIPMMEKPKDPDWEKLENSFNNWNWLSHGKVSTAEVIENMYYFLKAKYEK